MCDLSAAWHCDSLIKNTVVLPEILPFCENAWLLGLDGQGLLLFWGDVFGINSDAKLGHGSFGRVDFAGRKHGDSLLMCLCFIQEKNTIGLR